MSKFCPIFVHVLSKFCQCPIFVKIIEILLSFVKFLSIFCPKILIIVQVLSTVFFSVLICPNFCPSFVNEMLRTSDRIACPIFVKTPMNNGVTLFGATVPG